MPYVKNRIIHRFIRDIKDYEQGGSCYGQVLPLDTQVYAVYSNEHKSGLYYVLGDGIHTYTEIRDGHGEKSYNTEYKVLETSTLETLISVFTRIKINNLQDGDTLIYSEKEDCWINSSYRPEPGPTDRLDGGHAYSKHTDTADNGNAYTLVFDIIFDGGHAGNRLIDDENLDGGMLI